MLEKIFNVALFGTGALISAIMTIAWFVRFGAHEPYPWLGLIITAILGALIYGIITDKMED